MGAGPKARIIGVGAEPKARMIGVGAGSKERIIVDTVVDKMFAADNIMISSPACLHCVNRALNMTAGKKYKCFACGIGVVYTWQRK